MAVCKRLVSKPIRQLGVPKRRIDIQERRSGVGLLQPSALTGTERDFNRTRTKAGLANTPVTLAQRTLQQQAIELHCPTACIPPGEWKIH